MAALKKWDKLIKRFAMPSKRERGFTEVSKHFNRGSHVFNERQYAAVSCRTNQAFPLSSV